MAALAAGSAVAGTLTVSDFSFENYTVGTGAFQYSLSFSGYMPGWSFDSNSGITGGNSPFNPPGNFPDGVQAGILQGNGATISQAISGFVAGVDYQLDLFAGTRFAEGGYDGNAGVDFFLDGVLIGSTGAMGSLTPFQHFTTNTFTVATGGTHVLSFVNNAASGDHTAFVDDVSISFLDQSVPEPGTYVLAGSALTLLGFFRRKRR